MSGAEEANEVRAMAVEVRMAKAREERELARSKHLVAEKFDGRTNSKIEANMRKRRSKRSIWKKKGREKLP